MEVEKAFVTLDASDNRLASAMPGVPLTEQELTATAIPSVEGLTSVFARAFAIVSLLALLSACARRQHNPIQPPHFSRSDIEAHIGRYGIACHTYEEPSLVGPPSYIVEDIGKPGVPVLSNDQLAMVRRIRRYTHSNTLRFVSLSSYGGPPFAVFDTPDPCADDAPGYQILNSRSLLMYQPGESSNPHGLPPDMKYSPGPWMNGESPQGDGAW